VTSERGDEGHLATPTWTGPTRVDPADRIAGEVRPPGDKSIAHRALLFDALGAGEADIRVLTPGGDVRSTAGVLVALGALIDTSHEPGGLVRYRVRGGGTERAAMLPGTGGEMLDHGNSGTSMRLSMGALAGRPAAARQTGDASLSGRPMERVAVPLRQMGATVSVVDGHAPVTIRGARPLRALHHELPVASAQVLGAVSLAALAADGRTTITSSGPTRDHTERLLAWLGAPVYRDGFTTTVDGPTGFLARDIDVPGDVSSAAFWMAAAAIHPNAELRIRGVGLNPSRTAIIEVLREMGADITLTEGELTGPEPVGDLVVRSGAPIRAIRIDGVRVADLIDELPLLAIVMSAADGPSELRDAGELRNKESDRIALVVDGLQAIGVDAEELHDGWRVTPFTPTSPRPTAATVVTGGDHRIAMAFAIAAVTGIADSVTIDDPACAEVSYPTFWSDLARLTDPGSTAGGRNP
jgi:3-phosphoshikimate 1-carboxyvinyltransferase